MIIIPAIDLIEGQCVRLTKGDYSTKKMYHSDPLVAARSFEEAGLTHLHVVDLDGAKAGSPKNLDVLERLAIQTTLNIDYGGGVRNKETIQMALNAGAKQVNLGSIAQKEPEQVVTWIDDFNADKLILSADARDGMVAVQGWTEQSTVSLEELIGLYYKAGWRYVVCTDIAKDGTLTGPAFALYEQLQAAFPELKLIASGGVSSIEDLKVLQKQNCYGAIVGKAIYEGRVTLAELKNLNLC